MCRMTQIPKPKYRNVITGSFLLICLALSGITMMIVSKSINKSSTHRLWTYRMENKIIKIRKTFSCNECCIVLSYGKMSYHVYYS